MNARSRTAVIALAAGVAAAVTLATPALAAKDDVILISRATGPAGAPVDGDAIVPSISASGAQVAFDTDAATSRPRTTTPSATSSCATRGRTRPSS